MPAPYHAAIAVVAVTVSGTRKTDGYGTAVPPKPVVTIISGNGECRDDEVFLLPMYFTVSFSTDYSAFTFFSMLKRLELTPITLPRAGSPSMLPPALRGTTARRNCRGRQSWGS